LVRPLGGDDGGGCWRLQFRLWEIALLSIEKLIIPHRGKPLETEELFSKSERRGLRAASRARLSLSLPHYKRRTSERRGRSIATRRDWIAYDNPNRYSLRGQIQRHLSQHNANEECFLRNINPADTRAFVLVARTCVGSRLAITHLRDYKIIDHYRLRRLFASCTAMTRLNIIRS